jgi:hypothetical protein
MSFRRRKRAIYTNHVRDEMGRRRITEEDVEAALANHHTSYPGTNPGRATIVRVGTGMNGRSLCVVVDGRKEYVVVTAFWREAAE